MYLGFLDPLQMLSPPHEAACRRVFRECTVAFTTSNPLLLPYSWKNGTAKVVVVGSKNREDASYTEIVHNGCAPLVQDET